MIIPLKNGQPWRMPEQCSFLQQGATSSPPSPTSKRKDIIGLNLEQSPEFLNSLSFPTMMVSFILSNGKENIQTPSTIPAQSDWFAYSNRQNNHSTPKGVLANMQGLLFLCCRSFLPHKPYIPSEKSTFPTHCHKFTNDIFIKNRVIISRICV